MNVVAVFRTGEDHWQREREEDGRERPGEIACHGFCRGTIGQPGDEEATTHVTEWGQAGGEHKQTLDSRPCSGLFHFQRGEGPATRQGINDTGTNSRRFLIREYTSQSVYRENNRDLSVRPGRSKTV